MKAELKLQEIKSTSNTSLGVDICHIELTLILKSLSSGDDENKRIKFNISSTGMSPLKINSNNNTNELRLFINWLDEGDRKDVSNSEKVMKFIKEKLDAHRTLNSKKTIGLG
tara:strand:- start:17 stop:352 length:336 start_codon:yes stop_codon:yes gene_type:complete